MKKLLSFLFFLAPIVIIFAYVAHLDYELVSRNDIVVIGDIEPETRAVSNDEDQTFNFTLEKRFEKRERVGDYWVETYREYEIYVDRDGNVVKAVPTSNLDYIRYWAK